MATAPARRDLLEDPMMFAKSLRTLALLSALLVTASCGPDTPVGPDASPAAAPASNPGVSQFDTAGSVATNSLLGGLIDGVLVCKPQAYASTSQLVGPEGGTIKVGRHTLVIPAGALNAPVQIKAEAPTDPSSSVRFSPEGLQFNAGHSPVLTLDYSNCPAGRLNILKHIAYTTERLKVLSRLVSLDNLLKLQISAPIEHFSRYAVAW
jgi:hypothetical protein